MQTLGRRQNGVALADPPQRAFNLIRFQEVCASRPELAALCLLDHRADALFSRAAFQFGKVGGESLQAAMSVRRFHPLILSQDSCGVQAPDFGPVFRLRVGGHFLAGLCFFAGAGVFLRGVTGRAPYSKRLCRKSSSALTGIR